jgi:hypothetical protein
MSSIRVAISGTESAVYEEAQVRAMLAAGQLRADTLAFKEGMSDWQPLSVVLAEANPTTNPAAGAAPVVPLNYAAVNRPEVKDPAGLTRVLKIMLGVEAVAYVVQLASHFAQYNLLSEGNITEEAVRANDIRQFAVLMVLLVVSLATLVVFLMWVYRTNKNCRGFGAEGMKFTPGWAVGYFFVPIYCLFRPYQALREIAQASQSPLNWKNVAESPLVGLWWALWIIPLIISRVATVMATGARKASDLQVATGVDMVSVALFIVLTLITLALVTHINNAQQKLMAGRK